MRKFLSTVVTIISVLLGFTILPAQALPNLVANGDFESGSFAGWTRGGNTGATFVSGNLTHSGHYSAQLGPVGSNGTLSQTLNTTVGDIYELSFWFVMPNPPPSLFVASFQGKTLLTRRNSPITSNNWTQYVYDLTATSTTGLLLFTFREDPGYEYLDDVSLVDLSYHAPPPCGPVHTPVPEPGTMLMFGAGLFGLAVYGKRRRSRTDS